MRPSDARVAQLRGHRLIQQMEDERRRLLCAPALQSALAFALRTGLPAADFAPVRAQARARVDQLGRRIERVRALADLQLVEGGDGP